MGKIHLLPEALASQVAAGEVVERPASVVKELVENSLDSGAGNIEVRIQRGGIALIRVTDDGCGMSRDDALMCLERNATSKIRTKEDLAAICTLGFRGEAVPSIASVSKFRLTSRESGAETGTEILVSGGKLERVSDSGEAPGTQIEVRSLFFNLPARRKFLRTEATEYAHLEQILKTQAIAHEQVRFSLVRDERLAFQLPVASSLIERIAALAGRDLAGRLLEIEPVESRGVRVWGYIGPPGMGRSDRRQQLVFLNGRPVEAAVVSRALREGYHTALMKGQYPVAYLFLGTDPAAVDVNVHPAKREVRFHDGYAVQDAIQTAVAQTLRQRMGRPVTGVDFPHRSTTLDTGVDVETRFPPQQASLVFESLPSPTAASEPPLFTHRERQRVAALSNSDDVSKSDSPESQWPAPPSPRSSTAAVDHFPESLSPTHSADEESPVAPSHAAPLVASNYRIIGVLNKLFVLMESKDGLVLMDQHAAHERILFEELRRRLESGGVPSQRLLTPLTAELTPRDFALLVDHLDTLSRFGFSAEPFGGNALKIDSVPVFLKNDDPETFIHDIITDFRVATERMSSHRLGEDKIATTVCRAAVKANDSLREPELQRLLEDLLRCDMPYCCPHGRPTLIEISYVELERKFGRRQ